MNVEHDTFDLTHIEGVVLGSYDSAVLTTHGQYGEDGILQGYLETIGVKYTGSGVLASAIAMHKPTANLVASNAGLRVPESIILPQSSTQADVEDAVAALGPDCIIRPSTGGGSRGVLRSGDAQVFREHMQSCADSFDEFLLAPFITGVEVSVGIVEVRGELRTLPLLATYHEGDFYDYRIKHDADARRHVCPADVSEAIAERIVRDSGALYMSMGLTGFVRMDFIVDDAARPWFLEVNTLPGLSRQGNLATMAAAAGMSYEQLVGEFVGTAKASRSRNS